MGLGPPPPEGFVWADYDDVDEEEATKETPPEYECADDEEELEDLEDDDASQA